MWTRRGLLAGILAQSGGRLLGAGRACRFVPGEVDGEGAALGVAGFREHVMEPGGDGVRVRWTEEVAGACGFGFAFGLDYREFGKIRATLARSGRVLASVDVSLAPRFDPYFVPLAEADARAASREGLLLQAEGGAAARAVLSATGKRRQEAPALHPYLMVAGTLSPLEEYLRRMRSLDVTQEFDWRAGCVTEGLYALGERQALRRYLRLFLTESTAEGTAAYRRGVEQTLPAAVIARAMPGHHAVREAIGVWDKRRSAKGNVQDGSTIVAEANYTVAYPMAVLRGLRGDREFGERACVQLREAARRLVDGAGNVYLRHNEQTGERTYLGWARGMAWYLLGMAATLDALPAAERPADLVEELRRALGWAVGYQRADGLWCGFLPEAEVAPDTSGSAGIGAALRIARRMGVGEPSWEGAADRALAGCVNRLSVHGFLGGVSQSNKKEGGEAFQRSAHRVSMQFGMGLMGVLLAETRRQRRAG